MLRTILPDLGDNMYFMQDGAPAHYGLQVRAFLNETKPNRWIGRQGPIEWPARSPDLTPMDFFLWGVVKNEVFGRSPRSIRDLRDFISDSFANINADQDLCRRVCRSVSQRLQACSNNGGRQFEHLL